MFDIFLDIPAQKFLKKLDITIQKELLLKKRKFLGLELASFVCFIELIMKIIV